MKDIFGNILDAWQKYWGESLFLWLFLLCMVVLLVFGRKQKTALRLALYAILAILFFFVPYMERIMSCFLGEKVYWRMLWILPTVPVIVYAMILLIDKSKNHVVQFLLVLLCSSALMLAGKDMWTAGNYQKVANRQQVYDSVAQICDMIRADSKAENPLVAANSNVAAYIRVYDPAIRMPYGRWGRDALNKDARKLSKLLTNNPAKIKKICKRTKKLKCDYLVYPAEGENASLTIPDKQFRLIGTVNQYQIYRIEYEN
ncbi:MAG: hypothetical protein HUJ72_08375 [Blautia sp.]|nr:hypothetical protein [Blautia sp.]